MGRRLVGSFQFQASVVNQLLLTCRHSGGRQMTSPDTQAPPNSAYNCHSRADCGATDTVVPCTLQRLDSPSPTLRQPVTNISGDDTRGYAAYFTIQNT